jgi:hypothetical protein
MDLLSFQELALVFLFSLTENLVASNFRKVMEESNRFHLIRIYPKYLIH